MDKPAANSKLAPLVFTNLALSKITTQDELNQYITENKKSIGACPSCKKSHSFEKSFPFGKAKVPSIRLSSCDEFMKSARERGELVESLKACYACLGTKHTAANCQYKHKGGCESLFGCGYVLSGTHPSITTWEQSLTRNAKTMMNSVLLNGDPSEPCDAQPVESDPTVSVHLTKQYTIPEFLAAEDLGIRPLKS